MKIISRKITVSIKTVGFFQNHRENSSVPKIKNLSKISHGAEERKRGEFSGFFIIQIVAENQSYRSEDPCLKNLTMTKKVVKLFELSVL